MTTSTTAEAGGASPAPATVVRTVDRARGTVSAAVMDNDRPDSRLPHILERLAAFSPVIVPDHGDPWRTSRAAWSAIAAGATHHLVVQNDVRIAPSLPDAIATLVATHPDAGVAFYAQWDTNCAYRVRMGVLGGERVVEASARDWVPAQGLLLPRHACEAIAALPPDADRDDDEVLARVLHHAAKPVRVALTVPNLMEHDDDPGAGFNAGDGLRRTACYDEDPSLWSGLPATTWDGPGWEEIGVGLSGEGAHLDFGMLVPVEPQALRQVRVPWRRGVRAVGLDVEVLGALADRLLDDAGPRSAPDDEATRLALHEYAVACVLQGIAWRRWWRGGRPAGAWQRGQLADAALVSLWRSGGSGGSGENGDALADGDVLALAWHALEAGAELDDVPGPTDAYAGLTRWFRTTRPFDRIW